MLRGEIQVYKTPRTPGLLHVHWQQQGAARVGREPTAIAHALCIGARNLSLGVLLCLLCFTSNTCLLPRNKESRITSDFEIIAVSEPTRHAGSNFLRKIFESGQ